MHSRIEDKLRDVHGVDQKEGAHIDQESSGEEAIKE